MHELPLVFFTVLGQTAAGAFILLMLSKQFGQITSRQLSIGLLGAITVMGVGLLVGAMHMGQPLRMLNMLFGLGRSPMSNEIILAGAFAGSGGLAGLGLFLKKGSENVMISMGWMAAILAALFIASVPAIYQLDTVATWNTLHTTLQMILTAFIGGGALAAALGARRLGAFACIGGIAFALIVKPDYLGFLGQVDAALMSAQSSLWIFQACMLVVGLVATAMIIFRKIEGMALVTSFAVLVICGELAGRIAFYNLLVMAM